MAAIFSSAIAAAVTSTRYRSSATGNGPCVAHGFAVWPLAGQVFDALDIPAPTGPAVLTTLRQETGGPQDVIEVPGEPGSWRFLVTPQRHTPRALLTELATYGATYLTNIDRIEPPPTRVASGVLR